MILYIRNDIVFQERELPAAGGNFLGFSSDLRFWNAFSVKGFESSRGLNPQNFPPAAGFDSVKELNLSTQIFRASRGMPSPLRNSICLRVSEIFPPPTTRDAEIVFSCSHP